MTQNARILKAVVIGLGVLILIAMGLIVYKVVGVATGMSSAQTSATVAVPAGSRVVDMTQDGDRLSLLIEDGAGRQQVMTIDRKSGAVMSIVYLEPQE